MWKQLAKFVLKYRLVLLIILTLSTALMAYYAAQVKLSYEFSKAIPTDNPKYLAYQNFKQKFGDDGNLLVVGTKTDALFTLKNFKAYQELFGSLKAINGVEDILSIPGAINLKKDELGEKLNAVKIFPDTISTQQALDSALAAFLNLPFYNGRLYNLQSNAQLMGVRVNKDVLRTKERSIVIANITNTINKFSNATGIETHVSGLPLIRTVVADRIQKEMKVFLIASLVLSLLILLAFFRSLGTTLLSLLVVGIGVVWAVATIHLLGYQITLLTALIPSLVVVIGIPNCIYFLNKYHSTYRQTGDKENSLIEMVGKMGIVTLFCNIAAAIGFAVFALTKSAILKEFGMVAGVAIMLIFVVSFILLPAALSYLPSPSKKELKYLDNKWVSRFLDKVEHWVFNHKKTIWVATTLLVIFSLLGMMRLKTVGYIVDDMPKTDVVYTDLKFFEKNFKGVMPLEIMIDAKKRRGLSGMKALSVFEKVDSLAQFIAAQPEMNYPLSIAEGLKFAKQGFFEGDSASYSVPNAFDGAFVAPYLKPGKSDSGKANNFTKMLTSFIDTSSQYTRMSVSMADVGTERLPLLLEKVQGRANQLFDSSYNVTLTGTSITFLEGSRFIINGLKESILWAFLLIALCMLYLFRSWRILLCSLIPNVIPLLVTAGIMGWAGVRIKPSTVLVFSVALGIAVDITIRFLVNYKQELPLYKNNVAESVRSTIQNTGLSIVYTSLVLIAGFIIFCASSFGGTFALGWLTSVTLLAATITNLVLLPVLIKLFSKK